MISVTRKAARLQRVRGSFKTDHSSLNHSLTTPQRKSNKRNIDNECTASSLAWETSVLYQLILNTESTKCRFFEPSFSSRIDFFASGINKYLATLDKKLVTPHSKCFFLSLSKIFPRFEIWNLTPTCSQVRSIATCISCVQLAPRVRSPQRGSRVSNCWVTLTLSLIEQFSI